jgi:hypothetical protein
MAQKKYQQESRRLIAQENLPVQKSSPDGAKKLPASPVVVARWRRKITSPKSLPDGFMEIQYFIFYFFVTTWFYSKSRNVATAA